MSFEAVLSPIRLGNVDVPNRVVQASHLTQYTRQGEVTDRLVSYHEARARGRRESQPPALSEPFVMDLLGHSTTKLTMDTYSHIMPALHREAADAMERPLGG